MNYTKQIIELFTKWIETNDAAVLNWLTENGFKELIILKTALLEGDEGATTWLIKNKPVLGAFVKAVNDDQEAFKWLMQNKMIHWAAVANTINNDEKAEMMLRLNKLGHYADLAIKIKGTIENNNTNDLDFLIKGPFRKK